MTILGYMAIVCIGIVLGGMGAGGSMLAIPVLVYVFTIDIETATAYSLFLVGTTSLTGAALKGRDQLVSFRAAFLFGVPSVIGAFICRKWIIVLIPNDIKDHVLLALFAVLMLASSVRMLLKKKPDSSTIGTPDTLRLTALGFVVGLVTSLAGVGGGFLIIPALTIFAGLSFATATGTSLLIIACNCLFAFSGDVLNRPIDWYFLLPLTVLAVAGLLGGYWYHRKTEVRVAWHHVFAWFLMLMGVTILATEIF
jgi:uncharacterized membrane protein YfcA